MSTALPSEPGPSANSARTRRRIGEVLVGQGLLTEDQLQTVLAAQSATAAGQPRKRLGSLVIDLGMATEKQVAEALAEALGLPLVDLGRTLVVPEHVRLLPRAVAERSGVIVLGKDGGRLTVAASDPTNVFALDDVKLYTGASELHVVVATDSQVRDHLGRAWSLSEDASDVNTLFEGMASDRVEEIEVGDTALEAAPIVRLVDVVLADAVRARASDVHVEPQAGDLRIRYRVDGLLRDVMTVPRNASAAAVSRIKIVSGLDIAERRRPQDGRAKLTVDGTTVEARISTLPTLHGEKVVIRLLPRAENVPLLSKTGMTPPQLEAIGAALDQTRGLVLITGPTGSGKTNTLYAAIQQVSTPDRNIVTLEDPVEVQVAGITQVQVQDKAGLTFARGLRSILRQDPDIVLVGEVRDHETGELAMQASLTGHLVLTTLHTNDAVSAITRLVDMGVEPFLVASSLTMVIAQRLVRRPCASCIADYVPSALTLSLLGLSDIELVGATPKRGKGCADCGDTGYRGRTGVYEVLPITSALRQVLLTTPTEAAIGTAARAHGMLTLRASALAAAHRGETTYEEVLRATPVDSVTVPKCPTCARALADDMVCCPWDGALLGQDRCTSCDRQLDAEWSTCPWCRTIIAAHAPALPAPVPLAEISPEPVPVPPAQLLPAQVPLAPVLPAPVPPAQLQPAPVLPAPVLPAPEAALPVLPAPIAPARVLPKVLVIDGDSSACDLFAATLAGAVDVTPAYSPDDALTLLASTRFDAVLVDELLSGLSGTELVRLLRADAETAALPLGLLTNSWSPDVRDEALRAGADDVLAKPLDPVHLEERVLALLVRQPRTVPALAG